MPFEVRGTARKNVDMKARIFVGKGEARHMTLRGKTLVIFGATLTGLLMVCYAVVSSILMHGVLEAERNDAVQNVERVREVIHDCLENLNSRVWDWANWDDLYNFAADANATFVETNLTDQTFIELKLNMVLIFDSSQRLVLAKTFDLAQQRETPFDEGFKEALVRSNPFLWHTDGQSSVTGLLATPKGPMLAASRPILTSEGKGRIHGVLMMGAYLNEDKVRYMSRETRLDFSIEKLAGRAAPLPQDYARALDSISETHPIVVQALSEENVAGYTLLRDLTGTPIALGRVLLPRTIYQHGMSSHRVLIVSLLAIGLLYGGATLLLMEKWVLARVLGIIREVEAIGGRPYGGERLQIAGSDELSTLGCAINSMLETLELSRDDLRRANEELEARVRERTRELDAVNESLRAENAERRKAEESLRQSEANYRNLFMNAPIGIFQASPEGRLLTANPALASTLGYSSADELMAGVGDAALQAVVNPSRRPALLESHSESNGWFHLEGQYVRKDGSSLTADVRGYAARDADGHLLWVEGFVVDITRSKELEESLRQSRDNLERLVDERTGQLNLKTAHLEEANAALKALLRQRDKDREEFEESVLSNVKNLVFPYIVKLRKSHLSTDQAVSLELLESHVGHITSPFVRRLSQPFLALTPTEIQVADLIRAGKSSKEIADILNLSESTVLFHRNNLRSKLGLKGKKTNLRTYLQSLQ
jgi:PAS domain S-box-containing protein